MLTRYALAMVFLRKRPLAHYNPKKFPLRGPKDALRAARYARRATRAGAATRQLGGMREQSCTPDAHAHTHYESRPRAYFAFRTRLFRLD